MAEYIEREAIRNHIYALYRTKDRIPGIDIGESLILLSIDQQPAADVAPAVHGRWVKDDSGVIYCSECGEEHEWEDYRASYCDTCGAKMDGGEIDKTNKKRD